MNINGGSAVTAFVRKRKRLKQSLKHKLQVYFDDRATAIFVSKNITGKNVSEKLMLKSQEVISEL